MMNWSGEVEKLFETALQVFPEDYPNRWERIAEAIPGATKEMVCQRYHELKLEVAEIESIRLPPSPDHPATDSWPSSSSSLSCGNHVPVLNQRYDDKLLYNAAQIELGRVPPPDYPDSWPSCTSSRCAVNHVAAFNSGHHQRPPQYSSPIRKSTPHWSLREHILFLLGVEIYGKGKWSMISKHVVMTRSANQVASHAQKFYLRQSHGDKNVKRGRGGSIHDFALADISPEYLNQILSSFHSLHHHESNSPSSYIHQVPSSDLLQSHHHQVHHHDLPMNQSSSALHLQKPWPISPHHHQSNSASIHYHQHQVPSSDLQSHHHDLPMNQSSSALSVQKPWPISLNHHQSNSPSIHYHQHQVPSSDLQSHHDRVHYDDVQVNQLSPGIMNQVGSQITSGLQLQKPCPTISQVPYESMGSI